LTESGRRFVEARRKLVQHGKSIEDAATFYLSMDDIDVTLRTELGITGCMKKLILSITALLLATVTLGIAGPIQTEIVPRFGSLSVTVPDGQVLQVLNFVELFGGMGPAGLVLVKDGKVTIVMIALSVALDKQEVHRNFAIAGPAEIEVQPGNNEVTISYSLRPNR